MRPMPFPRGFDDGFQCGVFRFPAQLFADFSELATNTGDLPDGATLLLWELDGLSFFVRLQSLRAR